MSSTQEVGEIFGKGTGPAHAMLRSPTVLIASVGLWGMNIYFFRLFGINYTKVLKYDLLLMDNEQQSEDRGDENGKRKDGGGSGGGGNLDDHSLQLKESGSDAGCETTTMTTTSSSSSTSGLPTNAPQHYRKSTPVIDTTGGGGGGTAGSPSLEMQTISNRGGGGGDLPLSPSSGNAGINLIESDNDKYATDDDEWYYDDDLDNNLNFNNNSTDDPQQKQHVYEDEWYNRITWGRLVSLSLLLLFLLHSTYFVWIDILGGNQLGAVFCFYGVVTTAIAVPLSSTRWLRKATVLVIQRSFELINPRCSCVSPDLINGPRMVPFVDVFFADAMCSLSKVFFDWGFLLVMALHYPDPVPQTAQSILIPSACAAIPFFIRARQCLIMYNYSRIKNDPKRFSHLWNALKYSTSIFPLCLSAFQKTLENPRQARALEKYLILLLAINALYALYWDIVMDWGMMQQPKAAVAKVCTCCSCNTGLCGGGKRTSKCCSCFSSHASSAPGPGGKLQRSINKATGTPHHRPAHSGAGSQYHPVDKPSSTSLDNISATTCTHALLRSRLRFGVAMSAVIVLADCVLRFGWTLRFFKKLFPSEDSFVLFTQFLEVFRRALWNLLRVEWENSKQTKAKSQQAQSIGPLMMPSSSAINSNTVVLSSSVPPVTVVNNRNVVGVGGNSGEAVIRHLVPASMALDDDRGGNELASLVS